MDGIWKPFAMDPDSRHETDLAEESGRLHSGFSGASDGARIAYREKSRVWLADAEGGQARGLCAMSRAAGSEVQCTHLPAGRAVMHAQWRPTRRWIAGAVVP